MAAVIAKNPKEPWTLMEFPAGWEVKFDTIQRRHFFIDHKNKTTSWEDPRCKVWQAQQARLKARQQGPSPTPGSRERTPELQVGHGPQHGPQHTTPQKHHNPLDAPSSRDPKNPWQSHIEDKYGLSVTLIKDDSPESQEMVDINSIMARFPMAGRDLITSVIADCKTEEAIRSKLMDMGYREQKPAVSPVGKQSLASVVQASSNQRAGSPNARSQSPSQKLSPAQKAPSPSQKGTLSSHKGDNLYADIVEENKRKLREKFQKEFPTESKTTIEFALESCSFYETKTRQLLQQQQADKTGTTTSSSNAKNSANSNNTKGKSAASQKSRPTAQSTKLSPSTDKKRKQMKEKLGLEFPNDAKLLIELALESTSFDESKTRLMLQQQTKKESKNHGAAKNGQHSLVSMNTSGLGDALEGLHIDHGSSVIGPSHYQALFGQESIAKGHDPSLSKGPNKELLITDYIHDTGPNIDNCKGPSMENYHGPCSEMYNGPQHGLAIGPVASSHSPIAG